MASQPSSRRAGIAYSHMEGHTCAAHCAERIEPNDRVIIEILTEFFMPKNRFMVFHVHCHPRVVERRFAALAKRA